MKETVEINYYFGLENNVSTGFNRLKAKLFNLIEASVPNREQSAALKAMIRGFANDEYRLCIENMRETAEAGGLITKDDEFPIGAEPLETYPHVSTTNGTNG